MFSVVVENWCYFTDRGSGTFSIRYGIPEVNYLSLSCIFPYLHLVPSCINIHPFHPSYPSVFWSGYCSSRPLAVFLCRRSSFCVLNLFSYPPFYKLPLPSLYMYYPPPPLFVIKTLYKTQPLRFTLTSISEFTCEINRQREKKKEQNGLVIRSSEKTGTY